MLTLLFYLAYFWGTEAMVLLPNYPARMCAVCSAALSGLDHAIHTSRLGPALPLNPSCLLRL